MCSYDTLTDPSPSYGRVQEKTHFLEFDYYITYVTTLMLPCEWFEMLHSNSTYKELF